MKLAALVFAFASPLMAFAQLSSTEPSAQTIIAERQSYADRSTQELRKVRQQLDTLTRGLSLVDQQRYAPLYAALTEAEEAIAEMRIASDLDFDARKLDSDSAKARVLSAWNDTQLSQQAAAAQLAASSNPTNTGGDSTLAR